MANYEITPFFLSAHEEMGLGLKNVDNASGIQGQNDDATEEELGVVKVGAEVIQAKCISDCVPGNQI